MRTHEEFIDPSTGEIKTNLLMDAYDQLAEENAALDFKIRQAAKSEVALRKELAKQHADDPRSQQIREVMEYWVAVCHKSSRTKIPIDGVRAQKVRSRLNQKFTVEDLKLAIDGAAARPFVGPRGRVATQEPGTRREDDLELILRDEKYVERFQGYAKEAQKPTLTLVPKEEQPAPVPSDYDPLKVVFDRAEKKGLEPKGETWRFRATCPAHDDNERSLLVIEGVDGRAGLYCGPSVRCEPEEIAKALGLQWGALFPAGHRHHHIRRAA